MLKSNVYVGVTKSESHKGHLISKLSEADLEIILPESNKIRSRTVVSRSRARATGKYPSWKIGRMIQWESHNELNAFRLLDASSAAIAYQEQPLMLRYVLNGESQIHYPDALVEFVDGRELWEIKRKSDAIKPAFADRTRFLEAALPQYGYTYRMVIAEDLAKEPRLSNVIKLLKYGREPVNDLAREHVRQILLTAPSVCWASASNGDLGPCGREVLSRLVLEGVLSCDVEQPLGATTCFVSTRPANGA